ncbi:hypothetical protein [Sulfurirhabdus autotrophica]|uniref:Uncharacterized protein n=1 Tax=Sulfurirhabdus autotrophica TaxID=1706046 RepID=A0A4R3XSR7_9PROT|nr:hypothetical protein [Sulfurirhabdus autotrophica]TCV82206.1 hypothetical protein EDC63_1238 [Sulfurirhabdus autotrophica]
MNSEEILNDIAGKLHQEQSVILLTGDSSSNASVLLNKLDALLKHTHLVLILGSGQNQNCYQILAAQLQLDISQCSHPEIVAKVEKQLLLGEQNKIVLLCHDAESYDSLTFDCLSRLNNLNASASKEFSLVLSGNKRLLKKLKNRNLRSLQQHISAQFNISESQKASPSHFSQWRIALIVPVLIIIYFWPPFSSNQSKLISVQTEKRQEITLSSLQKIPSLKISEIVLPHPSESTPALANLEHIFESEEEALAAIKADKLK